MSKNPEALRIIAKQMENAETFRTDELGVEAACLRDSADEIERLHAENERLREALTKTHHELFVAIHYRGYEGGPLSEPSAKLAERIARAALGEGK